MFLQNERGLGVKNGTLGTIEEVGARSMAVRTDDGRNVAFDLGCGRIASAAAGLFDSGAAGGPTGARSP